MPGSTWWTASATSLSSDSIDSMFCVTHSLRSCPWAGSFKAATSSWRAKRCPLERAKTSRQVGQKQPHSTALPSPWWCMRMSSSTQTKSGRASATRRYLALT